MLKEGQVYAILSDFRGSPRLVVNATNGNVMQRMDYDVWGRVTNDTNPGFQPFGFGGGIYDPDTGLVRLGVREYDPEAGRFMTKDIEFFHADGGNLYAFANGDPVNHVDSTGLDHWFWGCVTNPNAEIIRETMTPEEFRDYVCRYKLGQDAIKNLALDVATAGIPAGTLAKKARNFAIKKKAKELTDMCSRGKGTGGSSNR
jgi:RHS repeat-associated protein